jgi:hypothetical protein
MLGRTSLSGSFELLRMDRTGQQNNSNAHADRLNSDDSSGLILMDRSPHTNSVNNADTFIGNVFGAISTNLDASMRQDDEKRRMFINENMNADEISSTGSDMIKLDPGKKNSRKQIQFNLETINSVKNSKQHVNSVSDKPSVSGSRRNTLTGANFNLSELLNQLKMNEIRKRNANRSHHLTTQKKTAKENKNSLVNACLVLSQKFVSVGKKMRQAQVKIGNFIERPYEHRGGLFYCILKFSIILFSIVIGSLTTLPPNKAIFPYLLIDNEFFFYYELFSTVFLSIEYIIFIWSIGNRLEFNGLEGRLRFIRQSVLLSLEALLIPINAIIFITHAANPSNLIHIVSALRFFQIFRFLFIDRYAQTWKLLQKVVYKHRFELITSVYIGTIILLFSSYFILIFEKEYSEKADDNHFHTYADALYWSIITMATIGYGKFIFLFIWLQPVADCWLYTNEIKTRDVYSFGILVKKT